jgi:hypothetical protein
MKTGLFMISIILTSCVSYLFFDDDEENNCNQHAEYHIKANDGKIRTEKVPNGPTKF